MTRRSKLFASAPKAELLAAVAAEAKTKPTRPRIGKLDGKAPPRPRGRHASTDISADVPREIITIPVAQRLGFRPAEFAALIGVSEVTVWRGIKNDRIPIVDLGGIKIIPRKFAVSAGYIDASEA